MRRPMGCAPEQRKRPARSDTDQARRPPTVQPRPDKPRAGPDHIAPPGAIGGISGRRFLTLLPRDRSRKHGSPDRPVARAAPSLFEQADFGGFDETVGTMLGRPVGTAVDEDPTLLRRTDPDCHRMG